MNEPVIDAAKAAELDGILCRCGAKAFVAVNYPIVGDRWDAMCRDCNEQWQNDAEEINGLVSRETKELVGAVQGADGYLFWPYDNSKSEALGELLRLVRSEGLSGEANALVQSALNACFTGEQVPWRMAIPKFDFVIKGQVPSKANRKKLKTIRRRGQKPITVIGKTEDVEAYERSFARQLPDECRGAKIAHFAAILHVFQRSRRSDLDNATKVIFDCLQRVVDRRAKAKVNLTNVIADDVYLRAYQVFWGLSPNNPRVRIQLIPLQDELPFL